MTDITKFLPTTLEEARQRGWNEIDIAIISGDAYVDHPSFGAAVIGRVLERAGYRVGIIPQPSVDSPNDFLVLGVPRLFFGISPGNVDSMLMHFTALKRVRNDDPYTPGGERTKRPKRAAIAYTSAVKHACPGVPVVIGGIESSTRRFTHYDYWDNKLRRSVLLDSKADLLVYGMGENPILEVAAKLAEGIPIAELTDIQGTVCKVKNPPSEFIELPSFSECKADNKAFCKHFRLLSQNWDKLLVEKAEGWWVVQNPHDLMTSGQLDAVYDLPFTKQEHPSHTKQGGVPALKTVANSIASHRGCLADCSFCSISVHQGKQLVNRSKDSIIKEVGKLVNLPSFRGSITDVGGPSANMYEMKCKIGGCNKRNCVGADICPNLDIDHTKYLELLDAVSKCQGVKHVSVGSGIRYDLLLAQSEKVMVEILSKYVGGQLKVAPEHASRRVLKYMNKPVWEKYLQFRGRFNKITRRLGLKQYLIPYLITSHPGATLEDEKQLLLELEKHGFVPDQVQDYIPLPMTRSGVMFYTGIDPVTGDTVQVARTREEKEKHFSILRPKVEKYKAMRSKLLGDGDGRRGNTSRGRDDRDSSPHRRTQRNNPKGRRGKRR